MIREHVVAGLVAAGVVGGAIAQGLFEPTGYAAASIVIWAAVIAGIVGRVLPMTQVSRPAAAAGICLVGIVALALASVTWASDQGRAFEEAVRASFYLGLFTLAVCTARREARDQWLAGLTLGLAVVTLIAILAYLQPGSLGSQQSDIPNAANRLSYPIGYWNGAAALIAAGALLAAFAGLSAPTRGLRAAATGMIPLAILGIWLASSRGGALALAAGALVLVATAPDRMRQLITVTLGAAGGAVLIAVGEQMNHLTSGAAGPSMRADGDWMSVIALVLALATGALGWLLDGRRPRLTLTRPIKIGLAVGAAVAVAVALIAINPAQRFRDFKSPPDVSAGVETGAGGLSSHGRWQYWTEAVDAFESAPAGGLGAGGYESYWARHATVPLFVRNPHSLPLQDAAELGIPGIALLLGLLAAIGVALARLLAAGRRGEVSVLAAVVVAAAVGACFDWTWQIPAAFGPAVICAGLLAAIAPSKRISREYWLGVGAVAAAWLALVSGALVVLSELELRQSRDAAAANNIEDAINRARSARTITPWSAEPYTQLALLEEQRGDLGQALTYLAQAEQRDDQDWRLPVIESRLLFESGNGLAAGKAMTRARSLNPLSPIFGPSASDQG